MKCVAMIASLASIATLTWAATALSDGDPASDVLLAQSVFYPYSPSVAGSLQRTLNAETSEARRAHFPIKVALIDTPVDLGAIPTLFAKPQQYAAFLDEEISFAGSKQLLLVVMPNGYGVQGLGASATGSASTLERPTSRASDDLARAAIAAVPKLAAAAGHPIAGASGGSGGGDGSGTTELSVGALVFLAVTASAALLWFRHRQENAR
jgi:hypothetical protein